MGGSPGKLSEELVRSFSNLSVTSPTSQLVLQPFRRFTYVTAHSPTLLLLHLRHSSFSNPSFASPTSQGLHLIHQASRPWHLHSYYVPTVNKLVIIVVAILVVNPYIPSFPIRWWNLLVQIQRGNELYRQTFRSCSMMLAEDPKVSDLLVLHCNISEPICHGSRNISVILHIKEQIIW